MEQQSHVWRKGVRMWQRSHVSVCVCVCVGGGGGENGAAE